MANGVFNNAKASIGNGSLDLDTATLKVMLVNSTYVFNPDQVYIDNVAAGDPIDHEISVSGYARQTLTSKVVVKDDTNDFAYLDGDDVMFSSLAAGQVIGGAILFNDAGGADTARIVIAFYDLVNTATNGGNAAVTWATPANGGVLKLK